MAKSLSAAGSIGGPTAAESVIGQTGPMVDPVSVGASSLTKVLSSTLTKKLQPKGGVRLGSRDERRQVYTRFQEAVVEACAVYTVGTLEQSLHTVYLTKSWGITFRPWAVAGTTQRALAGTAQGAAEVLKAYLDLRLVANPAPLAAANEVLERVLGMLDQPMNPPAADREGSLAAVTEAQVRFVDSCRHDLWYLPQRWQIYRPALWGVWRRRLWALLTRSRPA